MRTFNTGKAEYIAKVAGREYGLHGGGWRGDDGTIYITASVYRLNDGERMFYKVVKQFDANMPAQDFLLTYNNLAEAEIVRDAFGSLKVSEYKRVPGQMFASKLDAYIAKLEAKIADSNKPLYVFTCNN